MSGKVGPNRQQTNYNRSVDENDEKCKCWPVLNGNQQGSKNNCNRGFKEHPSEAQFPIPNYP